MKKNMGLEIIFRQYTRCFGVFRAMVMSGTFMLLLGAYGWFLSKKDRLAEKTWYLKLMVYAISLPFIGNTVGWIMTEMGRQPWVVFGVMKTEDAVSPNVTFGEVLFSFSFIHITIFNYRWNYHLLIRSYH